MPRRIRLPLLSPRAYSHVAMATLVALWLIVLTGAAVRLTDSGLGCPDWPKCYGNPTPPLQINAVIEYGNRIFSGLVGVATVAAFLLAFRRRPFRRDLLGIAALLPLGVVAQAVLGGLTVEHDLPPGYVMDHYCLSMLILIAAVALAWRARHEVGDRERSNDRLAVWSVRALAPIAALAIFAGTAATAAGPHSGGAVGDEVHRLTFKGADTLVWVVHRHGTIAALLGVATLVVFFVLWKRGGHSRALEAVGVTAVLIAAQGLVGSVQYELKLPADMVWIHVALSALTWITVLWAVAAAGRLVPSTVAEQESEPVRQRTAQLAER